MRAQKQKWARVSTHVENGPFQHFLLQIDMWKIPGADYDLNEGRRIFINYDAKNGQGFFCCNVSVEVLTRLKSLLESWVTTFLHDWQPPLILWFWSKSDKD